MKLIPIIDNRFLVYGKEKYKVLFSGYLLYASYGIYFDSKKV